MPVPPWPETAKGDSQQLYCVSVCLKPVYYSTERLEYLLIILYFCATKIEGRLLKHAKQNKNVHGRVGLYGSRLGTV